MNTSSQHLLLDIWLSEKLNSSHLDKITHLIDENFQVVKKTHQLFEPYGETIVWILSESHFTVHTYPEHNYLSLDIYICNEAIDLDLTAKKILGLLNVSQFQQKCLRRGKIENSEMEDIS